MDELNTNKNNSWYEMLEIYHRVMTYGYSMEYLLNLSPLEFYLLSIKINEMNKREDDKKGGKV